MKKKSSAKGFTLIELLVVVLIIGILSAIALPGYRKAVEKSRVSDALTTMQAVAKSEHTWYLTNNSYTNDFANLDIDLNGTMNNGTLATEFYTYELLDTGIIADRNNGEYSIYKDYENQQILCSPGTHYICEDLGAFTKVPCEKVGMTWANTNSTCYVDEEDRCKGLYGDGMWRGTFCGYTNTGGQELNEGMQCRSGGQNTCIGSKINDGGQCYGSNYRGCEGSTVTAGGVCISGAAEGCIYSVIENGGRCEGSGASACREVIIKPGGDCTSKSTDGCVFAKVQGGTCSGGCGGAVVTDHGVCSGNCGGARLTEGSLCKGGCREATVSDGSICSGWCYVANINDGGICTGTCNLTNVNDGGICISNANNYCWQSYYTGTGCCCGTNCGSKPKCSAERCAAAEAKYQAALERLS